MKRATVLAVIALLLAGAVIPSGPSRAQEGGPLPYLIKVPVGAEALVPAGAQHLFGQWWKVEATPAEIQALSAYGVYAELDGEVSTCGAPNDQYYRSPAPVSHGRGAIRQWWLDKILLPDAWDTTTGANIKVAILDTGYDLNHPDLLPLSGGWDFIQNDAIPQDEHGHGTHVAGILAAVANNSIGIAGGAPGAQFRMYRVMGPTGSGPVSVLATAIVSASTWANVISISAGTTANEQVLLDAVNTARTNGAVTVCAAGNNASMADFYPAYYCDLAVAAVDEQDRKASFTNYGYWWVDVAAPGVGILSTMPITYTYLITRSGYYQEYDAMDGTSMSTPIVAAVVALARAAGRCNSPTSCRDLITSTADRIPGTGTYWGGGRVNAVAALLAQPQPTPTPWLPTPTPTPDWPATPTPIPTPTPTPFVYPTPPVLPPWNITMSLPVVATPMIDPAGNPVVGYSSSFVVQKTGVDGVLGGLIASLENANQTINEFESAMGSTAWGREGLDIISGTVSMQAEEVRGQSVDVLRAGTDDVATQAQIETLASLATDPPTLREAASLIGLSASQPISYLRGWAAVISTANDHPNGQLFEFISAMIGLAFLIVVLFVLATIVRYILLPIASAFWNLLRDIWNSIPLIG